MDSAFAFRYSGAWWIDNLCWSCQLPSIHVCYRLHHRGKGLSRYLIFSFFSCPLTYEFKDDGYGISRTPTFGRVMSDLHRRDTSLTTTQTLSGDPSSKIWGLYLSQAEKFDKEHSESWTANTEGVLVFVRHNSYYHGIVKFLPRGSGSDWSLLRRGGHIPRCQLSVVAAQSNRYHQSTAYPNLPTTINKWDGLAPPFYHIIIPTSLFCHACERHVVH